MEKVISKYGLSQRRACRIIGQNRSSYRYKNIRLQDEDEITEQIVELAREYGHGYRRITAMLRLRGYAINHKRVYRIWKELGLKVPKKQPKRRRLWLNDGSCIRLRAEHRNHVWSYDFVKTKVGRGRKLKILNIIDECTRECLASHAVYRIRSEDVKDILRQIMLRCGTPEYIRSDNGSEFICETGFMSCQLRLCISHRAHPGRMAFARVSTTVCLTSFSTERYLTLFLRQRHCFPIG